MPKNLVSKRSSANSKKRTLIAHIRFQLDQLSATNSHHEFEHICRHFARERITPNILPATGPVTAGGDGGRDFETFTSFIRGKEECTKTFKGMGESKPLTFACSITVKSRVKAKIQDDIDKICALEIPYIIYFFSNQSVSVSTRHELQEACKVKYGCRLEILDGEALAECFADSGLFWIAEEYLHVASDLFPEPNISLGTEYTSAKERCFDDGYAPYTFADFVSIKTALRAATFKEAFKPDLVRWIRTMEKFIAPGRDEGLVRRAKYEVCVAALRGMNNLQAKKNLVEEYFADWERWVTPAELRDTSVLLSYVSSAVFSKDFDFDLQQLHEYSAKIVRFVDNEITAAQDSPNRQADLIYTRSLIAHLPFLHGTTPAPDLDAPIKWWFKLLSVADKAPLFCLEEFVDGLTKLTPILSGQSDFERLLRRADEVLEKRTSGYIVAEKCRDRAFELIAEGRLLLGIAQLHRAKAKWFTGDTLRPTLLAMLALSHAYRELGLMWAAKYYALGAAYIVYRSEDDDIKYIFALALQELAQCNYLAGEWVSFSELLPIIVLAHYQYQSDPGDWSEHEQFKIIILHYSFARELAKAIKGKKAVDILVAPIEEEEGLAKIKPYILKPEADLPVYDNLGSEDVRELVQEQFSGIPFCDTGSERVYIWAALGIQWQLTCKNDREVLAEVEQLVAILQIALADMATSDLCLLPTKVYIQAHVDTVSQATVKEKSGDTATSFQVVLPTGDISVGKSLRDLQIDVCQIAIFILTYCSCLSHKDLDRLLRGALNDGLTEKTFIARPYRELFLEFAVHEKFDRRRHEWLGPDNFCSYVFAPSPELGWSEKPGPGYTKERALEAIANRYSRAIRPIKSTLERLRNSERFKKWVFEMRAVGKKDWWILSLLMNVVMNYRGNLIAGGEDSTALMEYMQKAMFEDEPSDAIEFPEDELYKDLVKFAEVSFTMSTTVNWHLTVRGQSPDFAALQRLLDVRFGQATDDVEHDDPF